MPWHSFWKSGVNKWSDKTEGEEEKLVLPGFSLLCSIIYIFSIYKAWRKWDVLILNLMLLIARNCPPPLFRKTIITSNKKFYRILKWTRTRASRTSVSPIIRHSWKSPKRKEELIILQLSNSSILFPYLPKKFLQLKNKR